MQTHHFLCNHCWRGESKNGSLTVHKYTRLRAQERVTKLESYRDMEMHLLGVTAASSLIFFF